MRAADHAARLVITVGGLAVLAAVLGMLAFLGAKVVPLFERGSVGSEQTVTMQSESGTGARAPGPRTLFVMTDEYKGMAAVVGSDGVVRVFDLAKGRLRESQRITPDPVEGAEAVAPTCWSFSRAQGRVAAGYADGSVQIATISFNVEYLSEDDRTPEIKRLMVGERADYENGYVEHAAAGQFRVVRTVVDAPAPAAMEQGNGAVKCIDARSSGDSDYLVALREDGSASLSLVRTVRPLGGGKARTSLDSTAFAIAPAAAGAEGGGGLPDDVFVTSDGGNVFALWHDGLIRRYAVLRGQDQTVVAADDTVLTEKGEQITASEMLLGSKTLVVGTSRGRVFGLFAARTDTATTPDRQRLVVGHEIDLPGQQEVRAIGVSQRDRSLAIGDATGGVFVRHMTSEKTIADVASEDGGEGGETLRPIAAVELTPKLDGLLAVDEGGRLRLWDLQPKHAEASVGSLFGKVWYEGEAAPSWNYQSSSGEDSAEPKLSLMPLIFGTLKATVYAMFFAVPLAIFAAIYTSEMLHPKVRNRVKPIVEAMASLPSVVLGFLAAIIIAPFARDYLPAVLIAMFVLPLTALLGGYLWQLLPIRVTARMTSAQHFVAMVGVLAVALALSIAAGPLAEKALFRPSSDDVLVLAGSYEPVAREEWPAWVGTRPVLNPDEARQLRRHGWYFRDGSVVRPIGSVNDPQVQAKVRADNLDRADIRMWLDGVIGGPWPGWFMLMFGPGMAIAVTLRIRWVDPWMRQKPALVFGGLASRVEVGKFLGTLAISGVIAASLAAVLTAIGLDARDTLTGPFNQRNSLVVGLIMGFAVIPIIYTVSEDALSSVPQSLRSASLGAGATRWQTAVRVVLPVAASGIFSACMIGLGRAAGETMIVVMATGNTPNMDWSMFSGFRTLAANIAVELPEAPRNETHYRVLFLCGLVLFALTGVVNTTAELVRQRFRRRAAGL